MKDSLKKTATHILYVHENICPHFIFVLLPLMPEGKFKNGQIQERANSNVSSDLFLNTSLHRWIIDKWNCPELERRK